MILKATVEGEKRKRRDRTAAAYLTAQLATTGYHQPNKFPKPEDVLKDKSRRVVKSLDEQRSVLARFARSPNGS